VLYIQPVSVTGEARPQASKWASTSFLFGVAIGVSFFTALLNDSPFIRDMEARRALLPTWVGALFVAALVIGAVAWSVRSRTPLPFVFALLMTVEFIAGAIERRHHLWAEHLRAGGIAAVIAVALFSALLYARQKRELERAVFEEGTALAFFVTVIVAAGYGVVQTAFHVPHVSLIWVPIFAGICWQTCLSVVARKYS
jgi:UDP-N-acetylmuramyl pentapeptide phosphotransferase/UDP-N-acetylglucosamine-1-phosphate transferase